MEKARRAVRRTRTAVRQHRRNHHGPHATSAIDTRVLRAFPRHAIFRDIRGAQPRPGGPRPGTGAHHHGQGLRVVLRPARGRRVVQARQAVRPSGEFARREMEIDQVQVESDLFRRQTQVDVGRHKRMHGATARQLGRTDDAQQRYGWYMC